MLSLFKLKINLHAWRIFNIEMNFRILLIAKMFLTITQLVKKISV